MGKIMSSLLSLSKLKKEILLAIIKQNIDNRVEYCNGHRYGLSEADYDNDEIIIATDNFIELGIMDRLANENIKLSTSGQRNALTHFKREIYIFRCRKFLKKIFSHQYFFGFLVGVFTTIIGAYFKTYFEVHLSDYFRK